MSKFLHLFCFVFLTGNIVFAVPLTATTSVTAASCPTQGSITVTASGGTPFPAAPPANYNYQIIAPAAYITPVQSSNIFNTLAGGVTYTIQVSDQVGSITVTQFVADTYTQMAITTVGTAPTCAGVPDGSLPVQVSGGRAPFVYSISGPAAAGPQASNTFTGLPAGNYTVVVTDACGEVRTSLNHAVPPAIDYTFSAVQLGSSDYTEGFIAQPSTIPGDCSHVRAQLYAVLQPNNGTPVTRQVKLYDETTNTLIYTHTGTTDLDNTYITLLKNNPYRIEAFDNCNTTTIAHYNFNGKGISISTHYASCGASITLEVITKNVNPATSYVASQSMPETFTILAGPAGVGSTQTNTIHKAVFTGIVPGTYTVSIADACETINRSYTVSAPPVFSFAAFGDGSASCLDSTAVWHFFGTGFFDNENLTQYTLTSGPASFTDIHGVFHTISYPVDITQVTAGESVMGNFPKGNYTAHAVTNCGRVFDLAFSVTDADLTVRKFSVSTGGACDGTGIVTYTKLGQNWGGETPALTNIGTGVGVFPTTSTATQIIWSGLPSGNYRLYMNANPAPYNLVTGTCPTVLLDTILHPIYILPSSTVINSFACNDGSNATITVSSVIGGFGPFSYEIINGPVIRPPQSSNVFSNVPEGSYTIRTNDACGNGVTTATSTSRIDPTITANNPACAGNNITVTATNYPGATYSWNGPNGFTATGNSFTIFNYDEAQNSGAYTLMLTYPGCAPLFARISLNTCTAVPVNLIRFEASADHCNVKVIWQTANEIDLKNYILQYSRDGIVYEERLNVPAATGSSQNNYFYTLSSLQGGRGFLRLKMIDADGRFAYSNMIPINNDCDKNSIAVFPNPFTDLITVTNLQGSSRIILYDAIGRLLFETNVSATRIDIPAGGLPKGSYLLKISSDSGFHVVKLIKK